MIIPKARKMIRWCGVAACAAAAVASYSKDSAAAIKRLFATLTLSNPSCYTDANGRTIFIEARGFNSNNFPICQIGATAGGTGETQCENSTAVKHQAKVTSLNTSTGAMTVLQTCATQTTWTSISSCTYTIPQHGSCGAADTATAASQGASYP